MAALPFVFNDGGRAAAGFRGMARDCVARSIAIVSARPYKVVYQEIAVIQGNGRRSPGDSDRPAQSACQGVDFKRKAFKDYMVAQGFRWTPTMKIGSGCTVHLAVGEIDPLGRHVVMVSGHATAVLDGVIHDTQDPSRDGKRCVYGYWTYRNWTDQRVP